MPPKPKKGKRLHSPSPKKKKGRRPPPPPSNPKRFTPWNDSFPTESFKNNRGEDRWVRHEAKIWDRQAISPDEVDRRITSVISEIDECKLNDEWAEFLRDDYLNTDIKKAVAATAIKNDVIIVPMETIVDHITDNYEDFDNMCGKTFIGRVPAANAVLSRDGFYYLTKQFLKFSRTRGEMRAYVEDASYHSTWVALSTKHLPEIKMVGFVDVVPYNREPFYTSFDIVLNDVMPDLETPNTWTCVHEWDNGTEAKTMRRNSLYVKFLCARRKVDDDGLTFRGIGKILALWAFACNMGRYRGMILEPVIGNYAKEPGQPHLGGPNMVVASIYHEAFKFQRAFAINDRVIRQHELWIEEGSSQVKGVANQKTVKNYYKALFNNNQKVFLPDQPPPFTRRWSTDAAEVLKKRMAPGEGGMEEREHQLALAIMLRPYMTEADLRSILARIIGP